MTSRRFIVYLGTNGKPQIDELASGVDARAAACGTARQFAEPVSVTMLTYENGQLFPDGTFFTDEREPVAWVDSKMLDRPRPVITPVPWAALDLKPLREQLRANGELPLADIEKIHPSAARSDLIEELARKRDDGEVQFNGPRHKLIGVQALVPRQPGSEQS